ncbi:uncharacterized protein LOC143245867 [Tachypleus tridentatus]|uniref:uncharacterized protein LOC143245867 n=1 Tax=Tachypleus tridentatus TaxID=6853 RepID=UPI003FD4206C
MRRTGKPNARCTVASRHQPYSALSPNQRTSIYQIHWERKSSYLPTKTVSYEDLSDKLCPLDGAANQLMKAKSQLGTVFEEEVYLGKLPQEPGELGNGQAINRLFVAEDTTSLASSIQHRSDESGYESDGTKNGSDESSNSEDKRQPFVIETDVPLVIAKNSISTSLSLRTSVKRTESKENCSLRTCVKRTESKENCSLRTGVKRAESKENCSLRTGVKRAESKENCSLRTSAKRAESKENCSLRIGVKRAESKENCSLRTSVKRAESKENCICSPQKTSDGNLQRFSAILQKLKLRTLGPRALQELHPARARTGFTVQ